MLGTTRPERYVMKKSCRFLWKQKEVGKDMSFIQRKCG